MPVAACCGRHRVTYRTAASERPGTRVRGRGGPEMCCAAATCVRDPAPGEGPDDRRDSNSVPGCGPTSAALHGIRAGRTKELETKFLLRDHAPPQSGASSMVAATTRCGDDAPVGLGHVGLWPFRLGGVWLVAAPLASAGPGTGIRRLGSSAGSNAAAGTCVHSPCADKAAHALVADWPGGGSLAYYDRSPREPSLPRDSLGRTRERSPQAIMKTVSRRGRGPVYPFVR
jgi:hypothetical protein